MLQVGNRPEFFTVIRMPSMKSEIVEMQEKNHLSLLKVDCLV